MPAAAHSRSNTGRSAGCVGEKARRARGSRASTSRQSTRQRRDSFIGVTNAPITIASGASPSACRVNGCAAAASTWRYGYTQPAIGSSVSIRNAWLPGTSA